MISRRNFIGTVVAGLAISSWPKLLSLFARSSKKSEIEPLCGTDGKRIFATEQNPESHIGPLSMNPLAIPPVISGGTLTLASGSAQILPGTKTNLLLINNSFPAPTIRVKQNDYFTATIINNLPVQSGPSVLHWHRVIAPANMSGHPKDAVGVGNSYSVNFPIIQRASTNFYHAHPDMKTGEQVYMGLVGAFIIEDDAEAGMNLPTGDFDIPLLLTDKRFDANNQLVYTPGNVDGKSGWIGDVMLVNGTQNPFLTVTPTLYRFRLINASNARFFNIGLSDGTSYTLIGNDGGLLPAPVSLASAMFSPAERLDILIDFSKYSQGDSVTLQSLAFTNNDLPSSCTVPQGAVFNLLEFQVGKTGSSGGMIPTSLPQIIPYNLADAKRTRQFNFAFGAEINGLEFSMDRIDQQVPFRDLEEWQFISKASNTHPVHVHGTQFQVVSRSNGGGSAMPPDPWEMGWKDVVRLNPADTINVLLQFSDYPGTFLIHCHKLEHADMGMMSNFEVDPINAVKDAILYGENLTIYPNPASNQTSIAFNTIKEQTTLLVVDERGDVVHEKILQSGSSEYSLETVRFTPGNYQVLLGKQIGKLVVVR